MSLRPQGREASIPTPGRTTLGGDGLEGDGLPYHQRSLFEPALGRDLPSVHTGDAGANQAERTSAEGGERGENASDAKEGEEEGGELTAERVGVEEEEGTEPVGEPHNLEGGKQELAGNRDQVPQANDELSGGGDASFGPAEGNERGGSEGPEAAGEAGEGAAPSPEMFEAIQAAQNDAREGQAEADAESAAFNAEMRARREQFDAEQEAVVIETMKAMSSADKRSLLVEMGWDEKGVKKLKDHELDGLIEGKFAQEARKTKILGMTPEELAELSPEQKITFLVDLGVDRKDLTKIGQAQACKAFDDIMRVAHVPGQHKVKIKIKGGLNKKSWEVTIKVDADGNADLAAKKKKGFLSKLWGWVKALIPIILTILGPLTGGISLIVLAVYQTAIAIQTGDWLGAVIGIAGAVVGVGVVAAMANFAKGAYGTAMSFAKIANVAMKVQKTAQAAQAAMLAAKAKNAGSLLGVLAQGASLFASFASNAAGKFAQTMTRWSERLKQWSQIISSGEKVAKAVKSGDPLTALGSAFDLATAAVGGTSKTGQNLQRAANITAFVNVGQRALKSDPPDYGAVAEAAFGIAGQLRQDRRIEDAARIVTAANRLRTAWLLRDSNPAAFIEAALQLAQTIQLAKYDAENGEQTNDDGVPTPDEKREAIVARYTKATSIVRAAGNIITAASAKPRPNYLAALDAATQLIADLTDNKRLDAAAEITKRLNVWTAAVRSKDEKAILDAAIALGESINGMADLIKEERAQARKEAEAQLGEGEKLPDDEVGELPPFTSTIGDIGALAPGVKPPGPVEGEEPAAGSPEGDELDPPGPGEPVPAKKPPVPESGRRSTPNGNYTVQFGDILSGLSARFNVRLAALRELNPQLIGDAIFDGQKLYIPGAEAAQQPVTSPDPTKAPGTPAPPTTPPAVEEPDRATIAMRGQRIVDNCNVQIRIWRGESSLGRAFYTRLEHLDQLVQILQLDIRDPKVTAERLRARIMTVVELFQHTKEFYEFSRGTADFLTNVGYWLAFGAKEGADILIGALAPPHIGAPYAAITVAIEEYYKGTSPGLIALKSALAAAFEVALPVGGKTTAERITRTVIRDVFRATGKILADFHLEAKNKELNREEKAKLAARYAIQLTTAGVSSLVKAGLKASPEVTQAEKVIGALAKEIFDKVVKVSLAAA
jgi:LysM repeat protein